MTTATIPLRDVCAIVHSLQERVLHCALGLFNARQELKRDVAPEAVLLGQQHVRNWQDAHAIVSGDLRDVAPEAAGELMARAPANDAVFDPDAPKKFGRIGDKTL
jgi:hypothetical protein